MRTSARLLATLVIAVLAAVAPVAADAAGTRAPARRTQPLNIVVTVGLVPGSSALLHYRGTFTGTPFGRGTVDVRSAMDGAGMVHVTFTLANRRGTLIGTATARLTFGADRVLTNGEASFVRGTGAYSRVRASRMRFTGSSRVADVRTSFRLSGRVTS